MDTEHGNRKVIWHGMFLFLLGLLTGFAELKFKNMRMGLAAHLEGLMNGTFLIALGAAWVQIKLPPTVKTTLYLILLYGTYGNWAITTLAAVFGASSLSPITGAGYKAELWQEDIVKFGFLSVGIAMIVSSGLILWGLRRRALVNIPI
jgi:hydroxylaminobenzene mutase